MKEEIQAVLVLMDEKEQEATKKINELVGVINENATKQIQMIDVIRKLFHHIGKSGLIDQDIVDQMVNVNTSVEDFAKGYPVEMVKKS